MCSTLQNGIGYYGDDDYIVDNGNGNQELITRLSWGWVEAEVDLNLRLNEVGMRFSGSLVEIKLRLSWVGVEISWHWIKEEIGLS